MMSSSRTDSVGFADLLAENSANKSEPLFSRIGIRSDLKPTSWTDTFSSLVHDYANWSIKGLDEGKLSTPGCRAAHLQFLIHAFVEDRILDGQIVLDADEAAFVEAVSRKANAVLAELCEGLEAERDWRHRLISGYVYAQNHGYEVATDAGPPRMHRGRVRKVACGRGYLGALIPLALAAKCGADAPTLRRMKNAFDCLMLGLQWLDDLSDWPEDVENGDINLMLSAMRERGPNPYVHPPNAVRLPNIAHALLDSGWFGFAAQQSKRWLAVARDRQHALGCTQLAKLVEERRQAVDAMAQKASDDASTRVLAQLVSMELAE